MGLLDKLFGKKPSHENSNNSVEKETIMLEKGEQLISSGGNVAYKVVRPLTTQQREEIEKSTILLRTGQLYMHYWTGTSETPDCNDQEWQNKVMFFWKGEEPFPKKSLPPQFESFDKRYFLFSGNTSGISLKVAQAMPWFGMPGLGEKHVCEIDGQPVTIPELNELGKIDYIEQVELSGDNSEILTDRENYFFLIDERITPFRNGNFYLDDQPVPISMAYSIGGIHLIRKMEME